MLYLLLAPIVSLLFDRFALARRSQRGKALEILLLRQQLRNLQRHHPATLWIARGEKLAVAVLAGKRVGLRRNTKSKLDKGVLLFKPDPILRWHRALVRRQ